MRNTIGMSKKIRRRSANWRVLVVLAAVAGGIAASLASGFRERTAQAAAAAQATPTPAPINWTKCADEGATCSFTDTRLVRFGAGGKYNYGTHTNNVQCSGSVFGDPIPGTAKQCDYLVPTAPTAPPADYSKVDDFLKGRRDLLRDDDFLIGYSATRTDATDLRSSLLSATTDNSAPTLHPLGQGESPTSYRTEFVAGRFFQTGQDVALQFIVKGDDDHYTLRGFGSGADSLLAENLPEQRLDFLPVVWTKCADEDGTCHFFDLTKRVRYGANGKYNYGSFRSQVKCSNSVFGDPAFGAVKACDVYEDDVTFVSAVGDFNGDGFNDLVIGNRRPGTLRIMTAVDVNNPRAGFKSGPALTLDLDPSRPDLGLNQITVGDFNGDKQPEVAGIYLTNDLTIHVGVYSVDPQTLKTSPSGVVALVKATSGFALQQIAAGRFTDAGHDQLLAAWLSEQNGSDTCKINVIDFDPGALQPKVASSTWSGDFGGGDQFTPFTMKLKTARFDWRSNTDQAVWMVGTPGTGSLLSVLKVDKVDPTNFTITRASTTQIQPYPSYHGMELAIGNFDKMKASLADPTKMERDPADQIAVMGRDTAYKGGIDGNCGGRGNDCFRSFLHTYSVDPKTFAITGSGDVLLHQDYMDSTLGGTRVVNKFWLLPTDLQGRSLRLGEGFKITVERAAPSVVLAAPPMHADYISPGLNKAPTVLNLSVAPDGFHSEYQQTDSSEATSTAKSKTSSTFAGEEKISASAAFGQFNATTGELENGVKISDAFTAKQDIKNSAETTNGTFSSTDFKVSQETGLSDVVWFKDTSYYLYVYPVLGQKVCPAGKPAPCAESDKVPLRIIFSAPKEATVQRLATDTLEWYQPPWEYGNIFSYPATLAQLKLYLPSISLLTQEGTIFATDDANATLETTWINGQTTGQSVAHEQLFTEENDLSIEAKSEIKFFGIGGGGESGLEVNLGGSNGLETLTESENRISSAKGITIQKRSIFADPFSYKYFFSPYIFGKQQPVGISDPVISDADLTTFGALRSAFTADPLSSGAGGWWRQTYSQHPDVALNHPNRWSYGSSPRPASGNVPVNCLGVDALTMNCAQPAERDPENPWLDPFHDMRGLFITKAENPGQGPQQQLATAGDRMSLQARVYNYSLKAMPAGTKVKVRFYGMEWDESSNKPANADGESFLIGETALDPIPPFSNAPGAPLNWVLAGTTFDTTAHADKHLVFWVAVWVEDADGKLVTEIAGHGLGSIPTNDAKPTFKKVAELEEMVKDPLSTATDAPQVSFSNNIGFYRAAFYVLPKTPKLTVGAGTLAEIKLGRIRVEFASRELGQKAEVSTMLRGGAANLYGVPVYFYDGDPQAGGRLFDIERLPVLQAGEQHKVNIHFRPRECGERQIFVTVGKGKDYEITGSSRAFKVKCAKQPQCETTCFRAPQFYANNLWGGLPRGEVWIAGIDGPVNTRNVWAIGEALKGGNSAVKNFNREYVAAQLSLLAAGDAGQRRRAALKSELGCYNLSFAAIELSNGAEIGPETTLEELIGQAEWAARAGRRADLEKLAGVFDLLNSDDPAGGCSTVTGGDATPTGPTTPPVSKYSDRPSGQ